MCAVDGYVCFRNSELICGRIGKVRRAPREGPGPQAAWQPSQRRGGGRGRLPPSRLFRPGGNSHSQVVLGGSKGGLFGTLHSDYSPHVAAACMSRLAKMAARHMGNRGFSIGAARAHRRALVSRRARCPTRRERDPAFCALAGIDDVTPRQKLLAAKADTIGKGYSECETFIAQYKQVRGCRAEAEPCLTRVAQLDRRDCTNCSDFAGPAQAAAGLRHGPVARAGGDARAQHHPRDGRQGELSCQEPRGRAGPGRRKPNARLFARGRTSSQVCMDTLHWHNSPLIMSQCGSKGSPINIAQVSTSLTRPGRQAAAVALCIAALLCLLRRLRAVAWPRARRAARRWWRAWGSRAWAASVPSTASRTARSRTTPAATARRQVRRTDGAGASARPPSCALGCSRCIALGACLATARTPSRTTHHASFPPHRPPSRPVAASSTLSAESSLRGCCGAAPPCMQARASWPTASTAG